MTQPTEPADEPPIVQRAARPLAGALLLSVGGWLLARHFVGVGVGSLALVVGAVLVGGWLHSRRAILLVTGAPLTGAGAGLLARVVVGDDWSAIAVLAGVAAGYAVASVVQPWAAVLAILTAALALAASGLDLERVLPRSVAGVVVPAVAIGLGVLLLVRSRIPRTVAVGATVVLAVASTLAVAVIAAAAFGSGSGLVTGTQALRIPDLQGRTLVVEASTGRTVLRHGELGGEATVVGTQGDRDGMSPAVEVLEFSDRVVVRELISPGATLSLTLHVPAGAPATVLGGAGNVVADLRGHVLDVDTTSGPVTVAGHARELRIRTRSGSASVALDIRGGDEVVVRTDSGDVDARVTGSPRITADAAAVFVEGYGAPRTGVRRFSMPAGRGSLVLTTATGTVGIVRQQDGTP